MIRHFCRVKHDPPHSYGDCLRASVACILEIEPVESVPHFFHDGCDANEGERRFTEWLASVGYAPFRFNIGAELTLEQILEYMGSTNTNVHYLLFGMANETRHVVICRGGKVVHNTAWYNQPLTGPAEGCWSIVTFVPLVVAS